MPLSGSVAANKGANPGYQPLLLVALTLHGTATKLLLSTHPLDGISGPSFPGIGSMPAGDYLGKLAQQDLEQLQSRSQLGIDRISKVTLHILDGDSVIFTGWALPYGFRGATLQAAIVLWEASTGNFTSDAPLLFIGTCDMETVEQGGDIIVVSANTSHNTAMVKLPADPIQSRCFNIFPTTVAQRAEAAHNQCSPYYRCGYSPDIAGGVGNTGPANHTNAYGDVVTDGAGIFIMCDFIRSNSGDATSGCMARLGNAASTTIAPDGDIEHDTTNRWTGRFSGIQWSPGTYYAIVKNYVSGSKFAAFSFLNAAILGLYHNLLHGTQWVNAKIANIVESGNDTKFEAMITTGDIGTSGVIKVVVNGVEIGQDPTGDPNLYWKFAINGSNVSTGGRNGIPIRNLVGYRDATHIALGDPYGSIARILVCVYKDIFTGFGAPTCRVLATGKKVIKVIPIVSATGSGGVITLHFADNIGSYDFGDGSTILVVGNSMAVANGSWVARFPSPPYDQCQLEGSTGTGTGTGGFVQFFTSANWVPPWVLLDDMVASNWSTTEINAASWAAAADYCTQQIDYIDQNGNAASHDRFKCQFALEERRSAADLIAAILKSFNGRLYWGQDGLLYLDIDKTLADQQPAPITGSNYNTGISSIHYDGTSGTGYVAYSFDETNCEFVRFEGLPNAQTPNQIYIKFQDEDNQFAEDSLGDADTTAINRAGGALQPGGSVIPESINQLGISNFDQATRISNVFVAERQYGNAANDPRGTMVPVIKTTVQAEHLRPGHLVYWKWQRFGITVAAAFRVLVIDASTNCEDITITLQRHNDLWYTDAYGQQPQAFASDAGTERPDRAPLPWQPYAEQPSVPAGAVYPQLSDSEFSFRVAEIDTPQDNGNLQVQLAIGGKLPIDIIISQTQPPVVPIQATIGSGGSIPAGTYFIQLCANDVDGYPSAPSNSIVAVVPVGVTDGTIIIDDIGWMVGTDSYDLFVGRTGLSITHQYNASGAPSSITLDSLPNFLAYGPPDLAAAYGVLQAKEVIHAGIIGVEVVSRSASPHHVVISGPPSGTLGSMAGRPLFLIGRPNQDGVDLPIVELNIVSSGGTGGLTLTVDRDPTGILADGDIVVIGSLANISSANTIGDAGYISPYAPSGVSGTDEGMIVRILYGKGRFQMRTIQSVAGGTTYTVAPEWSEIPDATSYFIVEEPTFRYIAETTAINARVLVDKRVALLDVSNYRAKPLLVQYLLGDATGSRFSNDHRSPFRIIWLFGVQGTRVISASDSQRRTDKLVRFNTSGIIGSTTTLAAAITTTGGPTVLTLASGAGVINGAYIKVDSEIMFVISGGLTTTPTVDRGALGTTAATHSNGATVDIGGALTYTLLPIADVPNQDLIFEKFSSDLNYVKILPDGSDLLPGGASEKILPDNAADRGTFYIKAPG